MSRVSGNLLCINVAQFPRNPNHPQPINKGILFMSFVFPDISGNVLGLLQNPAIQRSGIAAQPTSLTMSLGICHPLDILQLLEMVLRYPDLCQTFGKQSTTVTKVLPEPIQS